MAILGDTKAVSLSLLDGVVGDLVPKTTNVYDLGTNSLKWKNIYGTLKGNADTATSATLAASATSAATLTSTAATEATAISSTKALFKVYTISADSSGLNNDGHILSATWSSSGAGYGYQLFIDTDPTYKMALRQRNSGGTWSTWKLIPMADGTNASGTWGISITGNAATATTAGNVTGTVAIANGGTGATTAGAARTNLGLGTIATAAAGDYVLKSGDTMTGLLTVVGNQSSAFNDKGIHFTNGSRIGESSSLGMYSPNSIFIRPGCSTTTSSYGLEIATTGINVNSSDVIFAVGSSANTANGVSFKNGSTIVGHMGMDNASTSVLGIYSKNNIAIRPGSGSIATTDGITLSTTNILPKKNNTIDLGSSSYAFKDIYGLHFKVEHVSGGQDEFRVTYGSTIDMAFMIGTGNENHGIYDHKANKWLLVADSSGNVTVNGNATTATTASKLSNTSKIGDTNKPVYFTASGVPAVISYTIDKSVPSNAVFTDANVTLTATTTNANYEMLFSATADNTTHTEGARKAANLTYNPSTNKLTTGNIDLTGALTITGNAYLNNQTYAESVNTNALTVTGPASFALIPTAPTPAADTNDTSVATTAFVMNAFTANDAMVFKGVINSNSDLPATHSQGWTYRMGTAGTYAGKTCEVGDIIICVTDGTAASNDHWAVIQNNIDGAVYRGSNAFTDANIIIADSTAGKVKSSGKTLTTTTPSSSSADTTIPTSKAVWSAISGASGYGKTGTVTSITLKAGSGISLDTDNTAITTSGTRTISHADTSSQASVTASSRRYITAVTLDDYGHVTGLSTGTETVTNTDTKLNITLATTSKAYLTGVTTTPTSSAQALTGVADTGVYLTTTAGEISAVRHSYNVSGTEKAYSVYNSTTESIDFIFI